MYLCSVGHFENMHQDCQYGFTLRVHSFYKWQRVQESLLMENYAVSSRILLEYKLRGTGLNAVVAKFRLYSHLVGDKKGLKLSKVNKCEIKKGIRKILQGSNNCIIS